MFARSRLATALAWAFGGSLAIAGGQAFAQVEQRVEITGSNIKRIDSETATPVTVLTRQEIKQTGANTVRQVLDTITSTTPGELRDDGASASFAAGASGVSMRGLGKGATLVLLNGRRLAHYGLADGGKNTFVNVDAIPADIVERVEVLKDGASAIYGSDAMAGVINIITRRDYQGVGVSTSVQSGINPGIGVQKTAALVAGAGDIEKDGFNILGNVEWYRRQGYFLSDVLAEYPEWHLKYVDTALGAPSLVSWPGNLISPPYTRVPHPSCPAEQRNAAGACTQNLNSILPWSDPAERINLFTQARMRLGTNMEAFGEVSFSKTQTDYPSIPFGINAPAWPYSWFDGNAKVVRVVDKPLLPVSHPLNTFGTPVGIEYLFMDPGFSWEVPTDATQYRVMAGLKGASGHWGWEVAAGKVGAKSTSESIAPHHPTFNQAIESGEYRIGGLNSPELLGRMFRSAALTGKNSQTFIDAKLTGDLTKLPAGPLQAAFGAEHRREDAHIKSTDEVMRAELIERGAIWVEGQRRMDSVFAELEAPLAKGLTASGALRYDRSSGFGGKASPKLGLRYEATPSLLLRATAAGGFRAPNIPEVLGKIGLTGFFNGTSDPKRCETATAIRDILRSTGDPNDAQDAAAAYSSGCSASVPAMISANPQLEPETSRSATVGFVFQPSRDVTVAMDYFKIERRNEISYRDPAYVLDREDNTDYAKLISRLPLNAQDLYWASRANEIQPGAHLAWSAGQLVTLLLQYENFGKTETSGIDLDIKGRVRTEGGVLHLGLASTYALSYKAWDIDAEAYRPNTVGLYTMPRMRAVLSGAYTTGPWTLGARLNYTSKQSLNYDETDAFLWDPQSCEERLKPGDLPCYLKSSMTVSLHAAYTGIKNLRLSTVVNNLFERDAPVDLRGGYALRPVTVKLAAEYKF